MTQPDSSLSPVSRRHVLATGAGLAMAAVATRGVAAQEASPAASPAASPSASPAASPVAGANGLQPDGTWIFTDDRGVTVTLPGMPQRVIADVNVAAALWDLGVRPAGVFGWNISGEKELNTAGGNVDPNAVELLNEPNTTLDVERAAQANPDLILSLVFAEQYGIWSVNPEELEQVEQIAPIVAISGIVRADQSVERFTELAQALGIDLGAPEIATQQETYQTASDRLATLVGERAGMTAIFVATTPDSIYIANPDAAADVMLFRDLGLDVPALPVEAGEYWEQLSMEQALKYPTDILFYSIRSEMASLEDFQAHPTFAVHPAVVAGQVFPWNQDVILNYGGLAESLDRTSDAVEASDPAVVS